MPDLDFMCILSVLSNLLDMDAIIPIWGMRNLNNFATLSLKAELVNG